MSYKTVIWDFDGVWSKDRFYKSLKFSYPQVWDYIQNKVWGNNDKDLVNKWMRAELNTKNINKIISEDTGIDFNLLTETFLKDVKEMEIEKGLFMIVEELKNKKIKVGMVTNNMDVFTTITEPRLKFKELFEGNFFNSFDYKILKAEGLFDKALKKMDSDYETSLLIDDSSKAREFFESKGGDCYAYDNFEDFKIWADINLLK